MRLRARSDCNQKSIVAGLRQVGATVYVTAQIGGGFPDLVVGFRGRNFLLEVKVRINKKSGASRLSPITGAQKSFASTWRGQYCLVSNSEEALRYIGATC